MTAKWWFDCQAVSRVECECECRDKKSGQTTWNGKLFKEDPHFGLNGKNDEKKSGTDRRTLPNLPKFPEFNDLELRF